jgi:hypothetical protein
MKNLKEITINFAAVVLGLVIGSAANMAIVMASGSIIPPPEGADVTTMEGLKASIHLFQPKHFLLPFLAHALGTLVVALVTYKVAILYKDKLAYVIGIIFMIGGIANILMLPGPLWFSIVDIGFAYLPMSYLAIKIQTR